MPRYAKPKVGRNPDPPRNWDYDEEEPFRPGITVEDNVEIDTGLFWETGEPIYRLPNPIGFGRDEEW